VARRIQESILPQALPGLAGFEFGARMLPARAVGGDFYDVIPLSEGRVGLAVGDVSDKGIPAAIFMALTRSLLRAEATPRAAPARVLQKVNRHLLDMNDAGMFVSVLYGVLDGAARQFTYARAGHEIPLSVDCQGQVSRPPRGRGQPLGLLPRPLLDVQTMTLPLDSAMLLFTDGAPDAMDTQGYLFDYIRLEGLLRARRGQAAQAICDGVMEALVAYQGAAPQHDDITLLTIRALGSKGHGPLLPSPHTPRPPDF
jgi:serine phosphatase RsbU (regulator of sigma subunit)